jgi:hypothetical protein
MKSSLWGLLSALAVGIVGILVSQYSVSDICGWYLRGAGSPNAPVSSIDLDRLDLGGAEDKGDVDTRTAACQLSGNVPHCGCSYAAVESMNLNSMRSILSELVQTPFFRYFKTVCPLPQWSGFPPTLLDVL